MLAARAAPRRLEPSSVGVGAVPTPFDAKASREGSHGHDGESTMSSHAATQSNLADGLSAGKVIAVIGAGIGVAAGPFSVATVRH